MLRDVDDEPAQAHASLMRAQLLRIACAPPSTHQAWHACITGMTHLSCLLTIMLLHVLLHRPNLAFLSTQQCSAPHTFISFLLFVHFITLLLFMNYVLKTSIYAISFFTCVFVSYLLYTRHPPFAVPTSLATLRMLTSFYFFSYSCFTHIIQVLDSLGVLYSDAREGGEEPGGW